MSMVVGVDQSSKTHACAYNYRPKDIVNVLIVFGWIFEFIHSNLIFEFVTDFLRRPIRYFIFKLYANACH